MNASAFILYVAIPAMFLIAATLNPASMVMKGICITLSYLSLFLLDGWVCAANAGQGGAMGAFGVIGKDSSPFGLVFLIISVWSFALVGLGDTKSKEPDNDR